MDERGPLVAASIKRQLDQSSGPIELSYGLFAFFRTELLLSRLAHNEPEVLEDDPATADYYDQLTRLALRIVKRLRTSPTLREQDWADEIEILLLAETERLGMDSNLLSDATRSMLINQLSQRAARQEARLKAIAVSWLKFDTRNRQIRSGQNIGGYSIPSISTSSATRLATHRRRVARMMETLWNYAKSDGMKEEQRKELVEFWNVAPEAYGIGQYSKFYRASDSDSYLPRTWETNITAPGHQWHAGWEARAEQLK